MLELSFYILKVVLILTVNNKFTDGFLSTSA